MGALMTPPGTTLDEVLERAVAVQRIIGSPGYPDHPERIRERARADHARAFYPVGVARQMAAIAASGNRKPALASVTTPTLVIHGKDDTLVPLAGGIDTHGAIPGASLAVFDGMGHDLPEPLWDEIVGLITELTTRNH
jgi:pimeloyl-ACP methyl ester carboxylesterase